MENTRTQKYTVGFIFDREEKMVLLVHKQKPEWQRGKINGVGGKYEPGETPTTCMAREAFEETKLTISEESWKYVGTITQEAGDVGVLAAIYNGDMNDAVKNDHEEIGWFPINKLPENSVNNLHWLVPLALEKLHGTYRSFSVEY